MSRRCWQAARARGVGVSGDTGEVRLDLVASEEHGEGGDVARPLEQSPTDLHSTRVAMLPLPCLDQEQDAFTARRDGDVSVARLWRYTSAHDLLGAVS